MKNKDLKGVMVILILAGLVFSCQIGDKELGADLLPTGDNVILQRDTVFEILAYPMSATPVITSENYDPNRIMLLGELHDTISGSSMASVITQFNPNLKFISGPNMEIDSLMLFLYIQDLKGAKDQEFTIRVYELTHRIYMDSLYQSDFDPRGKYDPVPLVEKSFIPAGGSAVDFLIEDQDFRDKFLALAEDTSLFKDDSIFKDYFNGLYIEAESYSPEGTMAKIHLSNPYSLLSMKYANDSTEIDSTAGRDFKWVQFSIDQYYCQKINIFEHDFSGTHLADIIDDDGMVSPYCYVQGMTGVNTRLSFSTLEDWMERVPIAISYASLVLEVVPEEESGIRYDDLPTRLMLGTILEDGTYEPVYDHYVLSANNEEARFGGFKKAVSKGLFSDTTFVYRFNVTLHFQSMVDGLKKENDFILQVNDPKINPEISKLWGNLPDNKKRIRLEVAYLKL